MRAAAVDKLFQKRKNFPVRSSLRGLTGCCFRHRPLNKHFRMASFDCSHLSSSSAELNYVEHPMCRDVARRSLVLAGRRCLSPLRRIPLIRNEKHIHSPRITQKHTRHP
ncbi:hypothetical protein MRX96_045999 [Rhipicephalus microplus]